MTSWPELVGPAVEVAPRLLGALLRHEGEGGSVTLRVTEVEAYAGQHDPGSHAFRGRTARNQVMFGPAGRLYVYFTYGMHHCCNVVVGSEGEAAAVLLRAGEVVEGLEQARIRRPRAADRDLARGPARFCRSLDLDLRHNGADLAAGPLTLGLADPVPEDRVATGPRVGLRAGAESPWRFWLKDDPTVSTYRPAAARRARTGRGA